MGVYYNDLECRTCESTWRIEAESSEGLIPRRRYTSDRHFEGCTDAELWIVEEGILLSVQRRFQAVHTQTIRRLEALGVGTWEFTPRETLVREYDPPRCTGHHPHLHAQVTSVTAVLLPLPQYRDGWAWEIHRTGGPSTTPRVETWNIPASLENAALFVDAYAQACPTDRNAPMDHELRKHTRSIFGPGMTRCGRPIEAHWDKSRIVEDVRRATCRRCISHSQLPYYTPGYETTIRGVEVLRLPVGEGWRVRCTECGAHLDVADTNDRYCMPFSAVQAVVKAHALPGHSALIVDEQR